VNGKKAELDNTNNLKMTTVKYLNQFIWNDKELDLEHVPNFQHDPEYPSSYITHFGNIPINFLSVKHKVLPRSKFSKFSNFLISLGFVHMEIGVDSYKFIDYDNKIVFIGDVSNPKDDKPKKIRGIRNPIYGDEVEDIPDECNIHISVYPTIENKKLMTKIMDKLYTSFLDDIPNDDVKFFMIAENRQGLYTQRTTFKSIPIKGDRFDLFYGENFPNDILRKFVTDETDNLMLLHGDPGTGKSNLIKHLITKSNKKVIYIPPSMLSVISSPGFITFMMDNKNSILLIEDAEEVLSIQRNSATNNLLGLTDGFLKDALQLKVIATFNCKLDDIDPALKRKGRLYYEYKFDKLTVDEGRKLAKFMDLDVEVNEPMTIAEIFNTDDNSSEGANDEKFMGFAT
tara:strand:+ start:21750 stop:22946 length:1197 start_codon:yes stop_codon:yes gene_type:complete